MGSKKDARMRLRKYGRSYQLRLESAEDLAHLLNLGESLWMATSAPVDVFTCDKVFLEFVDSDRNGRIRCDEIQAAVEWLLRMFSNRERIGTESDVLRLDDINCDHKEGQELRSAAARILTNLGESGDGEISLSQVRDTQSILASAEANGDGIIPPGIAKETETAKFIEDILATVGGERDASGGAGVTEANLAQFLKEAESYVAWCERGNLPEGREESELMPLGARTPAAYGAFEAVRAKIEEYFRLCAAAAYDPAAAKYFALNPGASESAEDALASELEAAPIAPFSDSETLDLNGPINPAFRKPLLALREKVLAPILGHEVRTLSQEQWQSVCAVFAAHAKWQGEKPQTKVAPLGVETLRRYLDPRFREALGALIASDKAVAQEIKAIGQVQKLILYQGRLLELVNNFVSFSRLYDPEVRALFETGTIVMDGRQFTLCVKVENRAAHAKVAANSKLFVLYLDLSHGPADEKSAVAAAVTSGGKGNLYVGKHGIFVDRKGRLWDACVTQMIENPISFCEALTMPFRRIVNLIQSQVERFAGSGEKLLEQKVTKRAAAVATTVQTAAEKAQAPATTGAPASNRGTLGLLMGGSLAVAALGSAFAFVAKTIQGVELMTIVKVVCFVLLAVLVPTIISAWVKLRQRDVGTLLEASGWAINGRMRLTRVMRGVFTRRPGFPPKAKKERFDQLKEYAGCATKPYILLGKGMSEIRKTIGKET